MESSIMKNMVVLKGLPSNIVEEAFVILKHNEKVQVEDLVKHEREKGNNEGRISSDKNSKEYIVKEAEMLISDYISSIEQKKEESKNNNWKVKYEKAKFLNVFLFVLFAASVVRFFV